MHGIAKHPSGAISWIELETSDPGAARQFYAELLGWQIAEANGDARPYHLATRADGRSVAGITQLSEAALGAGALPHWAIYFAVDDVLASAKRAAEHGGAVLFPPSPSRRGTISVIRDPTGGGVVLSSVDPSRGALATREIGTLNWLELLSTDTDAARRFYTSLFDWKTVPGAAPGMHRILLESGGAPFAGLSPMAPSTTGAISHWGMYFSVADCDATVRKATSLGGRVLAPTMDIPGLGRAAKIADAQGASFAVIQVSDPLSGRGASHD